MRRMGPKQETRFSVSQPLILRNLTISTMNTHIDTLHLDFTSWICNKYGTIFALSLIWFSVGAQQTPMLSGTCFSLLTTSSECPARPIKLCGIFYHQNCCHSILKASADLRMQPAFTIRISALLWWMKENAAFTDWSLTFVRCVVGRCCGTGKREGKNSGSLKEIYPFIINQ